MSPVRFPEMALAARICIILAMFMAAILPARGENSGSVEADRVMQQYPSGSIQSVEAADAALEAATSARKNITDQAAREEQGCAEKFFASDCMAAVRERRRKALAELRQVEVEANAFKRRDQIEARDKALAEKNAREAPPPGMSRPPKTVKPAPAQPAETGAAGVNPRVAKHEEKLRRLEAEEQANQAKRAAKVEAYNRKVKESEERQREVEEKRRQRQEDARRKAEAKEKP